MSTQGSHRDDGDSPSSLSGMLSTLIPTGLIALAYVGLFIYLRPRQRRIYEPRTYLGRFPQNQRTPTPSRTAFGWVKEFLHTPDEFILTHHSLDGYLYIRYLKMITLISCVGVVITWPVLFPVYATGGAVPAQSQFNLLSFSNVQNANRYYATVFIAWIFLAFVLYVVGRESLHYIAIRQAYLSSPLYANRISSRTVLFTDVPERFLEEEKLRGMFPGIKHVWMATDCSDLQDLVKERDKTAMKLEGAEVALSRNANNRRLKSEKARAKGKTKKVEELEGLNWIDEKKRPTHKLGFLGCFGEKVDTISWSREHLSEVIPKVEAEQEAHWTGKSKQLSACFIEFDTIGYAQAALQTQISHSPKLFQARCTGVRPSEIVWSNLNKKWYMRDVLKMAANAFITVLIIFWAIPISFGGFISNIQALESFSWLAWIGKIPGTIIGIVTGLIPVVWVAVLMALVPIVCRLLAKFAGAVSVPEIEMTTQNWYFAFQVVNVFLITTFASGASKVVNNVIQDPSSAPSLIAKNLPTASNFYISYFILYGTAFAGAALLNLVALLLFYALGYLLDKTPRKKFNRYTNIGGIAWGSAYPPLSLLGVIILSYSVIAPLVLGFAAISMFFVYFANKYQMMYCLDTTNIDTQGASYGRAIQHLMVGVYLMEGCLIGLFAIYTGSQAAAAGPLILMIIFLVLTIFYHIYIRGAVKPLTKTIPRDLLSTGFHKNESSAVERREGDKVVTTNGAETTNGKHQYTTDAASPASSTGPTFPTNHHDNTDGLINEKPASKGVQGILRWLLHPNDVPKFPEYFYVPEADYSEDARREAYLDPSIISPTPSLWIVKDDMGISEREKAETGKVIGITDADAWYDEKGKLQTIFTTPEGILDPSSVEKAPVYEEKVRY